MLMNRIKKCFIELFIYGIATILIIIFLLNIGWISEGMSKASNIQNKEAWLNFFGALLGALIAIGGSHVLTILKNISEKKEKNKLAELIIKNFLKHEIEENFRICGLEHVYKNFNKITEKENFQFGFKKEQIQFLEFDKIKYELLKYDSEVIKHTLEVYDMLYNFSIKGDYKYFTIDKIKYYLDIYKTYRKKYIIDN